MPVRPDGNPCQKLIGYDANSLYPFSMQEPMPTGFPLVRRAKNGYIMDMGARHRQSRVAMQVCVTLIAL